MKMLLFGSHKDRWLRYNISLFAYNFEGELCFENQIFWKAPTDHQLCLIIVPSQ